MAARRLAAGGEQPVAQRRVGFAEEAEERRVDAQQAVALVQVVESDAETEFHAGRIIFEISVSPKNYLIPREF